VNTAPTLLLVFGKLGPNATCPYGLTVKQPAEAEAAVAAMLASFHKLNVDDPAVFDALDVEDPDYPDPDADYSAFALEDFLILTDKSAPDTELLELD